MKTLHTSRKTNEDAFVVVQVTVDEGLVLKHREIGILKICFGHRSNNTQSERKNEVKDTP